ncbi:hypothetical protein OHA72_34585 [Dactylosporangium sp. NBC_01737]|uniref:hypothetical protein n=1 Tax=Dactylosporangium sp. NBC_01737 TaxID=2975959 RepID=UPI002E125D89|nr:hypothetical protein OHA72_34585 [Dactylosporangium sp. NBC_01737]
MQMTSHKVTIGGLVLGAAGIAVLWAAGVQFPVAVPPGIVILLAGAIFVGVARWRWAPAAGVVLGLFVAVGWAISPTGWPNLTGRHGPTVAAGQAIQLIGVLTAVVAGLVALRRAGSSGRPAPRTPPAGHDPAR